jgi:hypothetical protein
VEWNGMENLNYNLSSMALSSPKPHFQWPFPVLQTGQHLPLTLAESPTRLSSLKHAKPFTFSLSRASIFLLVT